MISKTPKIFHCAKCGKPIGKGAMSKQDGKWVCLPCFGNGTSAKHSDERARLLTEETESQPEENSEINHPAHYVQGPECPHCGKIIECITITERMNFTVGNSVKYLWRAGEKPGNDYLKDLRKAEWYIKREIERASKAK